MRISDWSSDVCSSDLLRFENAAADPERFRAEFAPSASPMKVNSRAVSFATLIQFSGAVPGKTSSLNLAPAQPSMAGRPMPLEAPLRKRGSGPRARSEEHTSELQSLMRTPYAVFCL